MALNRTRRAAINAELLVCEQRISGLIEGFNFMAGMFEQSGEPAPGRVVRQEELAQAQAMLELAQGLRREMQSRRGARRP